MLSCLRWRPVLTAVCQAMSGAPGPATARGITFLSLEDAPGLVNVVVSVGCWERHRRVVRDAPALCVRGRLERSVDGVVNVVAHRIEALPVTVPARARDFR